MYLFTISEAALIYHTHLPHSQASLIDDSKLVVLASPLALYVARGAPGSVNLESVFLPYTTTVSGWKWKRADTRAKCEGGQE
jgi:hypothetical protein